jgi:hypothetical protein
MFCACCASRSRPSPRARDRDRHARRTVRLVCSTRTRVYAGACQSLLKAASRKLTRSSKRSGR